MSNQKVHVKLAYPATWNKNILLCREMTFLASDVTHTMDDMMDAFDETTTLLLKKPDQQHKKLSKKEILLLETYRLTLMRSVHQKIDERAKLETTKLQAKESKKQKAWRYFKVGLLVFAGIVGMLEMAVWTFYSASVSIAALVPMIVGGVLIAICSGFTAISILQFIGFEIDQVKRLLNISVETTEQKILATQQAQVKVADGINRILNHHLSFAVLTQNARYREYHAFATLINMDVQHKTDHFKAYKESKKKKFIHYAVIAFGLMLTLMETYLGTALLIGFVASSIVGTPLAAAIIGIVMLASVVLYFSMRGSGLNTLFNIMHEYSNNLKTELNHFDQPLNANQRQKQNELLEKAEVKIETKYDHVELEVVEPAVSARDADAFTLKLKTL